MHSDTTTAEKPARDRALDRDNALDRDLGLALDLVSDAERLQTAVVAFRALLMLWTPSNTRSRAGETLADFDAFLTGILSETPQTTTRIREDPAVPLQHARDLLGMHQLNTVSDPALRDQARLLADHVHEADHTDPGQDRSLPPINPGLRPHQTARRDSPAT